MLYPIEHILALEENRIDDKHHRHASGSWGLKGLDWLKDNEFWPKKKTKQPL